MISRLFPCIKNNLIYIGIILSLSACSDKKSEDSTENKHSIFEWTETSDEEPSIKWDYQQFSLDDFWSNNELLDKHIDELYDKMSLEERAAQLIIIAASENETADIQNLWNEGVFGGLLYLKLKDISLKELSKKYNTYHNGKTKTLFCADAEPSLMDDKFLDYKTKIPNTINIPTENIQTVTQQIDELLQKYQVKLNFGSVADFSANQAIINNRAWGKTVTEIEKNAALHVKFTQQDGIGATLKHFPGHGRVVGDSHKQGVTIDGNLLEYETFRNILQQQMPAAIMVGHISIKNNRLYSSELPATLNPKIMKDLLGNPAKKEYQKFALNFRGLIVTDAMNMKAVSNIPDADFKALQAGADMLVMPNNPRKVHQKVRAILSDDNHPLYEQLALSVKKVIRYKICQKLVI